MLAAPRAELLALIVSVSRNHLGAATLVQLQDAARTSLALPLARGAPTRELPYVVEQIRLLDRQIAAVERDMATAAGRLPETDALLTIPGVRTVTAATFLGTVGDVRAYDCARQVVRLAGLSLVESSSGIHQGVRRLSKRGRPVLRRHAYLLALRSVRTNGLLRPRFDAMVARNGGLKMKAVAALSRVALRLMYAVARDRRPFQERETSDLSRRARELAAV
jgi:transposase